MRFRSPCKLIHDQPQIGVNDTSPSAVASSVRHYRNLQRVRLTHVSHCVACRATAAVAGQEVLSIVVASHGNCRHVRDSRAARRVERVRHRTSSQPPVCSAEPRLALCDVPCGGGCGGARRLASHEHHKRVRKSRATHPVQRVRRAPPL